MTTKWKIPPFAWKTIRKQENNFICCTVSNPIKIYQFWGWFCLNDRRQTPVSSCLSILQYSHLSLDWLRVLSVSRVAPTYAIPLKEFIVSTKVRMYLIYQVMHLASLYSTRSGHCTILLNLLSLRNYQSGGNISYRRSLQHFLPSHRHL